MTVNPPSVPFVMPEHWPTETPSTTTPAAPIPWFLAPPVGLAACFFPRRIGPHLAASSWFAAIVAHGYAAISVAAGLANRVVSGRTWRDSGLVLTDLYDVFLAPLAALHLGLYYATPSWVQVTAAVVAVLSVEIGVLVAAIGLIVFISAGERTLRTWLRGVKLILWSSTALAIPMWIMIRTVFLIEQNWQSYNQLRYLLPVIALLGTIWWLTILIRLGARHRGPRDDQDAPARVPRCDACGYALTGLMSDARCPECGRAIMDSLPERRALPAFARARGVFAQLGAFFATLNAALQTRKFGERLSISAGWAEARRFALLNCVGVGAIVGTGLAPYWIWLDRSLSTRFAFTVFGFAGGIAAFLLVALLGAIFVTGRRDVLRRCIVVGYSTAWFYPTAVLTIGGFWAAVWVFNTMPGHHVTHLPLLGTVSRELIRLAVMSLCFVPALIDVTYVFRRTIRLLIATQYANA